MIVVNGENFEVEVKESKVPVVVDFWGPQCGPCLALIPQIEAVAGTFEGRVKFCKLNAAENRRLCISQKVMSLPTFLFFRDGEVRERLSGEDATLESVKSAAEALLV